MGLNTVTIDNNPNNPGHKLSPENYNIDVLDIDAILSKFRSIGADCIASIGSDVAMRAVAHVAENEGIFGPTANVVNILCDKENFRLHQKQNNSMRVDTVVLKGQDRINTGTLEKLNLPVYVKPVDSSGGKGISLVDELKSIRTAVIKAREASPSQTIVIEPKIHTKGFQICGDGIIVNGKIEFFGLGNNFFLPGTFAPFAEVFPYISNISEDIIIMGVQRLLKEIGYINGPFNVDLAIGVDGELIIFEVAPRLGGNFLFDVINRAYGVNPLEIYVSQILEEPIHFNERRSQKLFLNVMLHRKSFANDFKYIPDFGSWSFLECNVDSNIEQAFKSERMSNFFGNAIFQSEKIEELQDLINFIEKNEIMK